MNTASLPQFPAVKTPAAAPAAPSKAECLLLTAPEAAEMLGMSVRRFHQLRQSLPSLIVLGARHVRWRRAELVAWVEHLPANEQSRPEPAQLQAGRAARKSRVAGRSVDHLVDFQSPAQQGKQRRGYQQSTHPSNPISAGDERATSGAAAR